MEIKKKKLWENKENPDYFQKLEGNSEGKERNTGIFPITKENFRNERKETLKKREEFLALGRKHWDLRATVFKHHTC